MFAEVNSLIFLLIFLVYVLLCANICHRRFGLYDCQNICQVLVKWILFCIVTAMLLTVVTIYLWFMVLVLTVLAIKYIWGLMISKNRKITVTIILLLWMALVGTAGLQLKCSMDNEEEDDNDALEVEETEDSIMLNGRMIRVFYGEKL